MAHSHTRPVSLRRLVVLAGTLIALCLTLALASAPASASPYCGGWLGAYGRCYGAERSMVGVTGYGDHHSVCVGIGIISGNCSGGPGQQATFYWGRSIYDRPRIENNAAGNNFVHGETF